MSKSQSQADPVPTGALSFEWTPATASNILQQQTADLLQAVQEAQPIFGRPDTVSPNENEKSGSVASPPCSDKGDERAGSASSSTLGGAFRHSGRFKIQEGVEPMHDKSPTLCFRPSGGPQGPPALDIGPAHSSPDPRLSQAGDEGQWVCTKCRKVKPLSGPHLNGKMTVRSDCWPCGRKTLFELRFDSGGSTTSDGGAAVVPTTTSGVSKSEGAASSTAKPPSCLGPSGMLPAAALSESADGMGSRMGSALRTPTSVPSLFGGEFNFLPAGTSRVAVPPAMSNASSTNYFTPGSAGNVPQFPASSAASAVLAPASNEPSFDEPTFLRGVLTTHWQRSFACEADTLRGRRPVLMRCVREDRKSDAKVDRSHDAEHHRRVTFLLDGCAASDYASTPTTAKDKSGKPSNTAPPVSGRLPSTAQLASLAAVLGFPALDIIANECRHRAQHATLTTPHQRLSLTAAVFCNTREEVAALASFFALSQPDGVRSTAPTPAARSTTAPGQVGGGFPSSPQKFCPGVAESPSPQKAEAVVHCTVEVFGPAVDSTTTKRTMIDAVCDAYLPRCGGGGGNVTYDEKMSAVKKIASATGTFCTVQGGTAFAVRDRLLETTRLDHDIMVVFIGARAEWHEVPTLLLQANAAGHTPPTGTTPRRGGAE